jgi:ATP-binding cassette subfamily F protein 3
LNFNGSLILVSHDIDFLKPVVNRVVDIRKGVIKNYPGDIDYYLYKREELKSLESDVDKKASKDDFASRKNQKRIEAELRQNKYSATKDLVKQISNLEKKINELEKNQKQLELNLTDPEIYSNAEQLKETTRNFNNAKNELEKVLYKWEKLNEELVRIESQFS